MIEKQTGRHGVTDCFQTKGGETITATFRRDSMNLTDNPGPHKFLFFFFVFFFMSLPDTHARPPTHTEAGTCHFNTKPVLLTRSGVVVGHVPGI